MAPPAERPTSGDGARRGHLVTSNGRHRVLAPSSPWKDVLAATAVPAAPISPTVGTSRGATWR